MTEQRKIQLATEVDASGATQGFEKVKQGARDMAQAVTQAGQAAGKGLEGVGDGAKRAADGFTREEGRMRSAIQRATLDLKTLGATASEKLEAKISLQGLDASKLQPYITALRQVEEAQRSVQQKQAASSFTDGLRGQIAALREQIHLQSLSADEVLRYKAAQAGAADSAAPLILQLRNMRAAQEAVAQAARDQAAAQKEAAAAGARRSSFVDGLKQQAESIGKSRADLLAMQAAQLGVTSAAAPYIAKLREAEKGHLAFGAGAKLNAFQVQQLGFQMHDFVVQIASGQNALTAFVQQGSQLSGTFGGAGNAFKAILSTITPMRLAIVGAAAALGGFAVTLGRVESAARSLSTLQSQLAGTGRSDLFSTAELKDFLKELALAPGVTRETATSIVSELSKVKDIGGGLFRDLGRAAADYAKATGTDIPTAARALARAFADPERGAKQLDEALGSLSSTQLLTIERLSKSGDVAGAQRVLFDALQGSVKGLADNGMTPLQKSVNDLGNSWEAAMRQLDQSQGLRTINALLGEAVGFVTFLVKNADKVGGLGNIAVASVPGVGLPAAVANAVRAPFVGEPLKNPTASGKVTDLTGGTGAAAAVASARVGDDEIKRALDAAKSYKSQAGELADLAAERKRFNTALTASIDLYGKESEQAKRLRAAIAGVDEKAASVRKRGQRGGGNEAQQVLDAQLQQSISGTRDALEREREAIAFSERYLQGVYQAGEISLKDFYAEKTKTIERGVAAQVAALEKERADVEKHLAATRRTSPKDTSAIVKDETRLREIDADIDKARTEAGRKVVLANQESTASFKALDEQVLQYHASLKSLQGDEIGAARIRDEIARKQLAALARQSKDSASPITEKDQTDFAAAQRQVSALNEAKLKTSVINQQLQIEEERIGLAMRTGAVGEIAGIQQIGAARAQVVAELEKIVKAQEEIAGQIQNKDNWQLQIDTSRARLELEKLKGDLDPLKEKFDNLFKDAGADLFSDLANGGKIKDALKNFGATISRELSNTIGKELSQQVFGKGGVFGGAGGMFADLFGRGRNKPSLAAGPGDPGWGMDLGGAGDAAGIAANTAAVSAQTAASTTLTASITMQNTAFTTLAQAAYSAAAALNSIQASGGGGFNPFSSGGSLFSPGGSASAGFGSGAAFGNMDLGLFLSEGGYTGDVDPKKAAGIVHGKEYVFSAPAVRAIGVQRLERMHRKAKSGYADEELPGYSDGGYVTVLGSARPQTMLRSQWGSVKEAPARAGDVYHVSVTATPGMTREQAMNQGRDIRRGMQSNLGRRAKDT
jgi:hypothetical protein